MVILVRNLMQALLFLILSFVGVAGLYITLSADFVAVAQVLVYAGAISVLMIFAVMLTRGNIDNLPEPNNANSGWAAMLSILLFSSLVLLLSQLPFFNSNAPAIDATRDTVVELGSALVAPQGYVIPFEVASVLLLAALIGAMLIARPQKKDQ